ncbi:MAG: hypothetical protein RLZZ265_3202, partial [Verrucomicrobiota bacterium]
HMGFRPDIRDVKTMPAHVFVPGMSATAHPA